MRYSISAWSSRRSARPAKMLVPLRLLMAMALGLSLSAQSASPAAADAPQNQTEEMGFLGVRILKAANAGTLDWAAELPADCAGCRVAVNGFTSGQNSKELYFHLWVPRSKAASIPIRVKIEPTKVRGVLASFTDTTLGKRGFANRAPRVVGMAPVEFRKEAGGIVFTMPAEPKGIDLPPDDLGEVSQQYTFIETPGVYIRIGHADITRRRGPYATGRWPALEAQAALNLEFAAREAIYALGIDKDLPALGVSTIMLMNFDTNYPTLDEFRAHDDWPPHWHMHLWWNSVPKVRNVGHFYLSTSGLLTQHMLSEYVSGTIDTRNNRWLQHGQAEETRTPDGRLVYAQTITLEGFFRLASDKGSCLLTPIKGGFDSGVRLSCDNGQPTLRIRATDDPIAGRIRLFLNQRPSMDYRYDVDTGAILSSKDLTK